ncbi:zinc-binding alcohol dehydrogenase family protein [Hoeflea sp. WL0058]|uniref:Zinc-binding alcohol dehydrogenase family protein n=1 Tax=Flavimaribacter sediminis TaxID=2865987 RepID=A0AAE2ZQL5_9HYPH|nr:zinc-binding alcohol dehydrogenase family protein [Flavimaribacter sediminis]MBW8638937.1 zinc-binding alcohol dehydrogenase family protein [Flavimaribacter sediminis]
MTSNSAAWLNEPFAQLKVADAPSVPPEAGQIQVRNRAVAINPIDRYKQKMGNPLYGWLRYPMILGFDLAGEVVAVGPGVTRFEVGDRVVGHATGMEKVRNKSSESAFQIYSNVMAYMASPIPDTMTFEAATVLPLALSTAACGLFAKDQLDLELPTSPTTDKGRTLLVWGGSTSVGCNAIQLGKAAGYRIVTTASPHNFGYLKKLGADEVHDYNGGDAATRVANALDGYTLAGAVAMGARSAQACIAVLGASEGNKKVALATFPVDIDAMPDRPNVWTLMTRMAPKMMISNGGIWIAAKRKGVRLSSIWGSALMDTDLGPAIYESFLPDALRTGRFVAAPPPLVVGHRLEAIQPAFERQKKGVSAAKIVVTL